MALAYAMNEGWQSKMASEYPRVPKPQGPPEELRSQVLTG